MRALLVLAISLTATTTLPAKTARADKPTLAALAPATDARRAIAIGPAGQIYEPDGSGGWVRKQAGGITEQIVTATAAGNTVIAGAKSAPPFKLKAGAWTALHLGVKAKAIVGTGSRVLAAVGKSVFALDRSQPTKLTDAPDLVVALAASSRGVVIATDKGLMKLEGAQWKPLKKGPKKVRALISDRWALVDRGVLDLKTMTPIAWPAGVNIVEATAIGDDFVGVSVVGKTVELVTIKGAKVRGGKAGAKAAAKGKNELVEREKVEIDHPKPVVGVVVDKQRRVAIAMRDGRIAVRDGTTWTVSEVREELAAPKPGPAPAESQ